MNDEVNYPHGGSYSITYGDKTNGPYDWNTSEWVYQPEKMVPNDAEKALELARQAQGQYARLINSLSYCFVCGEECETTIVFCDACKEVLQDARRAYFQRIFEEFMAE